MGNSYRTKFKSILGNDDLFHYREFELDCGEIYSLLLLGNFGPMTASKMETKTETFPELQDAVGISKEELQELNKSGPRSTLNYSLTKLETEHHLVKVLHNISKTKRVWCLAFSGMLWYLQNIKSGFKDINSYYNDLRRGRATKEKLFVSREYEQLLPFLPLWEPMICEFGEQYCLDRLEKTAKDFFALKEVNIKKVFGMDVDGYVRLSPPDWMKNTQPDYYYRITQRHNGQRNDQVVEFLQEPDNAVLLNSYIAYLAIHDLNELSKDTLEHQLESQFGSFAEKELAYFEQGNNTRTPLLCGDRLIEYFPKYATIQYFFAGMFIESLIWDSETF